jgi:hypothetical protein
MKEEPVAWMEYIHGEEWNVWFVEPTNLPEGHSYIPLYTAPKPLSDEEIGDILFKYGEKDEWFNFARAIEERHGIK